MKVFVTGVNGQLGHDILKALIIRGHIAIGSGSSQCYKGVNDIKLLGTGVGEQFGHVVDEGIPGENAATGSYISTSDRGIHDESLVINANYVQLDITDQQAVLKLIKKIKPDAIIHCAAWTAVDAAEDEENKEKVDMINHLGTQYIAEAAKVVDAKMIYLSTDYVFDGQGERPWKPDDINYAPLNVYGQSKLAGELAVSSILNKYYIVRTEWVFGLNGKNFIKTMINVGKTHTEVRVVNDQIGTPTYAIDLSRLLVEMVETDKYGYYHATNDEGGKFISWYDFTVEIYKQVGIDTMVIPVSTAEYGYNIAKRPKNSRLDKSKLINEGFTPLPDWKEALSRYLDEIKVQM